MCALAATRYGLRFGAQNRALKGCADLSADPGNGLFGIGLTDLQSRCTGRTYVRALPSSVRLNGERGCRILTTTAVQR
jgi:hypothetical protein